MIRANPPLATLHELDTVYTIDHLEDFLEILDMEELILEESIKEMESKAKTERDRQSQQQSPGR